MTSVQQCFGSRSRSGTNGPTLTSSHSANLGSLISLDEAQFLRRDEEFTQNNIGGGIKPNRSRKEKHMTALHSQCKPLSNKPDRKSKSNTKPSEDRGFLVRLHRSLLDCLAGVATFSLLKPFRCLNTVLHS